MGLFDDKVVLVTGGGRGLGRAYAHALAAEGARVVVADAGRERDGTGGTPDTAAAVVAELVQQGAEALAYDAPLDDEAAAEQLVASAVARFGDVHALVASTGARRDATVQRTDTEAYRAVLGAHLDAGFFAAKAFARHRIAQGGGGRIVLTTGLAGLVGNFGQVALAAAMAGTFGLMRTLSIELQRHRVTVNALAPLAKTRMTDDLPMFEGVSTLGPEHCAPACLFLASDLVGERSGHVLAVAGARVYAYKVVESAGKFKDESAGPFTAEDIAEHWDAIVRS